MDVTNERDSAEPITEASKASIPESLVDKAYGINARDRSVRPVVFFELVRSPGHPTAGV